MAKLLYKNSVSTHATLNNSGVPQEISLHDGEVYELPENNDFIKLLIVQGKLVQTGKATKNITQQ